MSIKRRTVLLAGGAGALALIGGRWITSHPEDAIVSIVKKRLHYLQLDEAGVRQFAKDVLDRQFVSRTRLKAIAAAGPIYTTPDFNGDNKLSNTIRHGEERLVSVYLLSTDFFHHGADMSRTVQYQGYYDPMKACSNPFARPVLVT